MALTRGDKLIIIGAVALAGTVVLGLAVLKRPELFTGAPKTKPVAVEAPRPAPAAPPSPVATAIPPAPSSAPAAAPPATPSAAVVPQAATPAGPPAASGGAAKPPLAGDENLDKMFADLTRDTHATAGPKTKPEAKVEAKVEAKTPQPGPTPEIATVGEAEPKPAAAPPSPGAAGPKPAEAKPTPAKQAKPQAEATAKPAKAQPKPKAEAKAKPEATAKPQAAAGHVIRLVAEDKVGEFVLTVQTDKAPAQFTKMFLADPPRMVLDLPGSWTYVGPGAHETGNGLVRRIRVGTHPDLFRVVLDMAPDALSRFRGTPTADRVPGGVTLKIPK